jgi:hypothetical protein
MDPASLSRTAPMFSSTIRMVAGLMNKATTTTVKVSLLRLPKKVYLTMTKNQITEVLPIFNKEDDFFEDIAKQYDYDDRHDEDYAEDEYSDE